MFNSVFLIFLLPISLSEENSICPLVPNSYNTIPPDDTNFQDTKIYGCQRLFYQQLKLTNCFLQLHSCAFNNIDLDPGSSQNQNFGAIYISINDNMEVSESEKVEFNDCQFYRCTGGCIHIECTKVTLQFNFYECIFDQCTAKIGGSGIHFCAANGNIEKCYFYDNGLIENGGFIYYDPPEYGENDVKLTIKNNEFKQVESVNNDVYSFIYLKRDGCRLVFINNQITVYDSYANLFKYIFGASTTINTIDTLTIKDNCMSPLLENNLLDGNCKKIPISGFAQCSPIDKCLSNPPDYQNYVVECGGVHNNDPKVSNDGKFLGIFYSTFNMMTKNDDLGGAIYITTHENSGNIETPIQIYYSEFSSCAADYGGAIHIASSENSRVFDVHGCRFISCSNGWKVPVPEGEVTSGGAIFINTKQANVKISKCIFESCRSDNGGAIYYCSDLPDSLESSSKIILEGNEKENDFVLIIDSCTFYHNEINSKGAAIALIVKNSENLKPIEIVGCLFSENIGDQPEYSNEKPENGGAIYYEFNSQSNPSFANDAYEFLFHVSYCKFMKNIASFYGGAIYLEVTNYEPPKHFEINNCTFYSNRAGSDINDDNRENGNGGDIYFNKKSTSPASQTGNNEPCISILDCIFRSSNANINGGSVLFAIENNEPSRSIEVNGCSFKGCYSDKGGSIDIISTNQNVLLNVDNCVFQNRASLYFKSINGLVTNCQFINIDNKNAIYYESNSESSNDDKSFTIDSCNFTQMNDNCILVYYVPKISSLFSFNNNNINISEKSTKTWIFGCDSGVSILQGNWKFENNENYPYDEKYIKDENSNRIGFEASCSNGFRCGIVPTEEPTTEAPTTEEPTTEAPTTEEPTTEAPTTEAPTTEAPTTEEPTTEPPTIDYVPGTNCERNQRCYFDGSNLSPSLIDFSSSEFIDIYYPDDGGAIYIKNYGMICDVATFQNCSSQQGGGGGIYITLDREIPDEIFLQNITFKGCKAVFGGALYIYSIQNVNSISIISCDFIENEANKKPSTANDVFYGGGAIFMTISNGNVSDCKFSKNIGGGVKFYNNFDAKRSMKELESSSVLISNCFFEIDQSSTSSFYYVVGSKEKVPVEVNNCIFTGVLSNEAHHIDGLVLSDKTENTNPKLQIKMCKFSSNRTAAMNRKLSSLFASFDENIQEFEYEVKKEVQTGSIKDGHFISFFSISLVAFILLIVCALQYTKKQNESEIENEREII